MQCMETSRKKRLAWSCYKTVLDKNCFFSPKAFLAPTHNSSLLTVCSETDCSESSGQAHLGSVGGAELQFSGEGKCVGLG